MSKKHPRFPPFEGTVGGRRFYFFFGVLAILGGVLTISLGRLHYQNYRGDNVFAPSAILIGVLALFIYFRNRPRRKRN